VLFCGARSRDAHPVPDGSAGGRREGRWLLPEDREPIEMLCSVSEYMLYNQQMNFGNPTAGTGGQRPPKQ